MAFDLATNITPIIDGVVAIMPAFLDLEDFFKCVKSRVYHFGHKIASVVNFGVTCFDPGNHRNGADRDHDEHRRLPAWVLRQDPWHDQVLSAGAAIAPFFLTLRRIPRF